MGTIFDLSHTVRSGETTYPGLPPLAVEDHLSHEGSRGRYAEGVSFQISRVHMVANTGTAIDMPYHRFPSKADVSTFPLSRCCDLPATVVRLGDLDRKAVAKADLVPRLTDARGKAVLIETGWSQKWGSSSYFEGHPFLTADAARYLLDVGAVLVGVDSLNIDDTSDPTRPVHTMLLAAEVAIVENLTALDRLPTEGSYFNAAPLKIFGMGACPVRAWARTARPPEA